MQKHWLFRGFRLGQPCEALLNGGYEFCKDCLQHDFHVIHERELSHEEYVRISNSRTLPKKDGEKVVFTPIANLISIKRVLKTDKPSIAPKTAPEAPQNTPKENQSSPNEGCERMDPSILGAKYRSSDSFRREVDKTRRCASGLWG